MNMEFRHHIRRNDEERRLWVLNDEGLWHWYQSWCNWKRSSVRAFIRENRQEIDESIERYLRRHE
jgi:Leu/Phe-tRNA-protein transferase